MMHHNFSHTPLAYMPHFVLVAGFISLLTGTSLAAPVPGYVPPTTLDSVPEYVDDTRGVYVPTHTQQRLKTGAELSNWQKVSEAPRPLYAQKSPSGQYYEQSLNTVATGVADTGRELDRIAQDPGLLAGGKPTGDAHLYQDEMFQRDMMQGDQLAMTDLTGMPSLATGGQPRVGSQVPSQIDGRAVDIAPAQPATMWSGGGQEVAAVRGGGVDMQNSIVRIREERVSVRRVLQRMMDQIGAGGWTTVWDVSEQNAGLPDMEISMYAEEPFINVLNALLGRLQTRSGQPLRVVRYDQTQRLVITDRTMGNGASTSPAYGSDVAVTEGVLKEAVVSLHYDEIPLVDALENVVNQAGKGQWRLRMYAGTDQVLKPAHIEEPFSMALERMLKVFGLRYEVFPGGKLIVITASDRFGFRGVQ
ncbi:MAG: hypothetical protein COY40_04075 [Alphaproteobacteria bacterium CG_4_10_14_0_8_um_filter_53_9]|nr:MAG: hypothetical protein COY40_04075 [Alphaproteobacteria bacterium CG_4_10_14_0_8_um_filter_53_9]